MLQSKWQPLPRRDHAHAISSTNAFLVLLEEAPRWKGFLTLRRIRLENLLFKAKVFGFHAPAIPEKMDSKLLPRRKLSKQPGKRSSRPASRVGCNQPDWERAIRVALKDAIHFPAMSWSKTQRPPRPD